MLVSPPTVAVIGLGPFAQGYARLVTRADAGLNVFLGSRSIPDDSDEEVRLPGLEGAPVVSISRALACADVAVLAVPARALLPFVAAYGHQLRGKVVVDVSNPTKDDLAHMAAAAAANEPDLSSAGSGSDAHAGLAASDAADACGAGAGAAPRGGGLGRRWAKPGYQDGAQQGDAADVEACKDAAVAPPPSGRPAAAGGLACAAARGASEPQSAAALLQAALRCAAPGARAVKSLCNLSAEALLRGDPLLDPLRSVAASDHPEAAALFRDVCGAAGIDVRVGPGLRYAAHMEARQRGLLAEWQAPLWVMLASWLVMQVYVMLRYCYFGHESWDNMAMWVTNKSVAWLSLWGLVYTYAPGVAATAAQVALGRPAVRLPPWMQRWMAMRRYLGLLTLLAVMVHLVLSAFLWMPAYYSKMWKADGLVLVPTVGGSAVDKFGGVAPGALAAPVNITLLTAGGPAGPATAPSEAAAPRAGAVALRSANVISLGSRLSATSELSLLAGVAATAMMGVMGLVSFPGMDARVNWREWRLLQSRQGWAALALGTAHVLLLGAARWPNWRTDWPAGIPSVTLLSTVPAMALLTAKLLLALPARGRSRAAGAARPGGVACAPVYV